MIRKGLVSLIVFLFIGTIIASGFKINSGSQPLNRGWLYVGGSGPGNYTKIQDAVDNASDGDTVFVYSGVYYEHQISINKKINLVGENKETTIINGAGLDNGISCNSDFINISGITIKFFSYYALGLNYVNHVTIRDVIITLNTFMGISLNYAPYTVIKNCTIKNNYDGIWAEYCDNSLYIHNRFNFNSDCDIRNGQNPGTLIVENIFENSSESIFTGDSGTTGISIYHNFFTKNDCIDCGHNSWDNGYPSGGNYWDDYTGTDYYHGPNQNLSGSDGIGDTLYIIPEGDNQDSYPLMEPYDWSNEPPVADFDYSMDGSLVTFDASASYDSDGNITTWFWDFGDGLDGDGEIISHDYAAPGIYNVILIVVDDDRGADTKTKSISVEKYDFWVEKQKILASDGSQSDRFGCSVSIDGDFALAGAKWDYDIGVNSGSVYVFTRDGTTWTYQQKLWPSDGAGGDEFGASISLDDNIAIIGSPYDDDNGDRSGSAYVFRYTGANWIQQAKIRPLDGEPNDLFGRSVSISSNTAFIGAYGDDEGKGSVYVFTCTGSTWSQHQKLTASDGEAGDNFGWSVSLDGGTALIGAKQDNDNGGWSGSAYIFTRDGTTWIEQQKLLAADGTSWDDFGFSCSLSSDTALIGAMYDDENGNGSGSAYVFINSDGTWAQQTKILASDGGYQNIFGYSVSLFGDTAVIGAPGNNDNGDHSGSVYVFNREGNNWIQQQKLVASDGIMWDYFGDSVSMYLNTIFVGASNHDYGRGKVYVFEKESQNIPPYVPTIIGPANGKVGTEYDYNFMTFDPNSDKVSYFIDWGDGTNSGWLGPYDSGQQESASHSWSHKDSYIINIKAKDSFGAESSWGTLQITMPRTISFNSILMKFLERFPHAFPILRNLLYLRGIVM